MYDLSISGIHEYVANDVLVHNCRYLLNEANYDTVPQEEFKEAQQRSYRIDEEEVEDYDYLLEELYE